MEVRLFAGLHATAASWIEIAVGIELIVGGEFGEAGTRGGCDRRGDIGGIPIAAAGGERRGIGHRGRADVEIGCEVSGISARTGEPRRRA